MPAALFALIALAAGTRVSAADSPTVTDLIRALTSTGVDVIYSSDLVPPDLRAPGDLHGMDARSRVIEALAAFHLVLRAVGAERFVITRAAGAVAPSGPDRRSPAVTHPSETLGSEALSEVSVFASRYAFPEAGLTEPLVLTTQDIELFPGAGSDPLQALRGAPGLATNLSSRPYVRGAQLEDVLVEFDGIPLTNPFHFQNFQSLISAFDPFAVGRVELYTGGFPVQFGTRSGGVIDLAPRSTAGGAELRVEASLLSYDLATVGQAESLPLEWLVAVRHSSDTSLLRPLSATFGEPTFFDGIGRVRWRASENASWTLGTLLVEDALQVGGEPTEEVASARFHDRYLWLTWDQQLDADLHGNTSLALTQTDHSRRGILIIPGAVNGSLDDRRDDSEVQLRTNWIHVPAANTSINFGAEAGIERAALGFSRTETFSAALASAFGVPTASSGYYHAQPKLAAQGLFVSVQQRWRQFEAEFGVRLDREEYSPGGAQAQLSPRLNLRYDPTRDWHLYASWGEFTQAERAGEWRTESDQSVPDPAARAVHQIVGAMHDSEIAGQWRLELYRNHWTAVSPYYANTLNGVSLVPELEPDRVLLAPSAAETSGLELSGRRAFGSAWNLWGSYTLANATDEISDVDVPRSWDQRQAAALGIAWRNRRLSASLLGNWHTGWPRTPTTMNSGTSAESSYLIGPRNSARWGGFFTAGARVAYTLPLPVGDLSFWIESTNVTNRDNSCCTDFASNDQSTATPVLQTRSWMPRIVNAGFSWSARSEGSRGRP